MSLLRILPAVSPRRFGLTRQECACILEREFESVAEEYQEHPEGATFTQRLFARLPEECVELLLEDGLLEPALDS
jgi:hypothetical protein